MFWVIAVVALIWNVIGVLMYLSGAFMSEDDLKMLPSDQQMLINETPSWVTAAFAIAVWFGLLGAIALLIRRKLAYPLFLISFVGIVAQYAYTFFMSKYMEVNGTGGLFLPIAVIVLGIVFIWYSKKAGGEGLLK